MPKPIPYIFAPHAKIKEFGTRDKRLETFQRAKFTQQCIPFPVLAAAGFIYTGVKDTVQCYMCHLTINDFEPGEDPFVEHLAQSSKCPFIAILKFKISKGTTLAPEVVDVETLVRCQCCMAKNCTYMNSPCNHLCVCSDCVITQEGKCYVCSRTITHIERVYF